MRDANVPTAAVVGVVAREDVQVRVDADIENVSLAPRVNFHLGAVGPDADDAAAASGERRAVVAVRLGETEVADGDVDPAVDAHADAVGRVIGAALLDFVGADARDERFMAIGRAVAIVVVPHA